MKLNIKVDKISVQEARDKVAGFLCTTGQYKIFTPNPEMYVLAQKDKRFFNILNSGDLNICDGTGLAWFYHTQRISGVDFILEVAKEAGVARQSIYLLGAGLSGLDTAKIAGQKLTKKIVGLKIAGAEAGPAIKVEGQDIKYNQEENNILIKKINDSGAGVLLVGFGMGKQEKWIEENLHKMPGIHIAMGIGGSLDFYSGYLHRAPCFIQKIGLEWLYRLVQEPRRIGRIYNATIRFLFLILK